MAGIITLALALLLIGSCIVIAAMDSNRLED